MLNVPIDLPAREAEETGIPARPAIGRPAPASSDVETVAELLDAASFPLLVAGRGAVTSPGARAALEALGLSEPAALGYWLRERKGHEIAGYRIIRDGRGWRMEPCR